MSAATAHLLRAFEELPLEDKREFTAAIVHRAAKLDSGEIGDDELTASASRIFYMLDEEEDAETR
jgi:hypothetical protein